MSSYKIYKIIADANDGTDRFLCYIGSTKKSISQRLAGHEYDYRYHFSTNNKYITSVEIMSRPWYEISCLEDLGSVTRKQATILEGKYIKLYQQDEDYIVVNRKVEGRTQQQYYQQYLQEIKQYSKKYQQSAKGKKVQSEADRRYYEKKKRRKLEQMEMKANYFLS